MQNLVKICLDIECLGPDHADHPSLEIWLDGDKCCECPLLTGKFHIIQAVDDDCEKTHSLQFILKDKKPHHTTINANNEIDEDIVVTLKNFYFDNMNIDEIFYSSSTYIHDTNGTSELQAHPFHGTIGCNGTVEFKFKTPIYMWCLENL